PTGVATRGGSPGWGGRRGRVLAFDVSRLTSRSRTAVNRALLGVGYTGGTQPVGLALFDHDRHLAGANSNRCTDGTHGKTNVAILSVADPSAVAVKAICRSDER